MDATEAATPEDNVVGCADGFRKGYVEGWAWRPNRPHDTVAVQLVVEGAVVAESTACLPRPDLSTAGIGHGQHAFAIPFTLEPDSPPVLHVAVRVRGGGLLPPGEFEIVTSADTRADLARRRSVEYLEQVFGPFTSPTPPAPRPVPPPPAPRLNFILYTARGGSAVATTLGMPEYSYLFVMRGFRDMLRQLGVVHQVHNPAAEVDPIYDACLARGESCLFFSFAPPQSTPLGLRCHAIPVIAWEFSSIPTGEWGGDPREDWRHVLRQTGRAITISEFAARVIRHEMGAAYPVASIPTPVWDRLASLRAQIGAAARPRGEEPVTLLLDGWVWDSRVAKLSLEMRMPPLPEAKKKPPVPALPMRGALLALAQASQAAQAQAARDAAEAARIEEIRREEERQEAARAQAAREEAERIAEAERLAAEAAEAARIAAEPPPRKTLRQRAGLTLWLGRQWYREVVRDILPRPFTAAVSLAGRGAVALRGGRTAPAGPETGALALVAELAPVPALPEPPAAPEPPPAPEHAAVAPEAPEMPAAPAADAAPPPRYAPAQGAPPLPEPELANFDPDPYPPPPPAAPDTVAVRAEGVIFTAVLSPKDGRKNWQDIVTAFFTAFTATPDATLILKMIGADASYWWWEFHELVKALPPFACRVLVLSGYLDDEQYGKLIAATDFVVNASLAEGQCLPLVEFMSAGRPAIAPLHTAMLDYITPENAVIVASDVEFCSWPHDPRNYLITTRHRIEWASVRDTFLEAFRIVREDPARHQAMGRAAAASVRDYCADAVLGPKLADFLGLGREAVRRAGWAPLPAVPVEADALETLP